MFSTRIPLRTGHVGLLLLGLATFAILWGVLHAPQPTGRMSGEVGVWWTLLCAISVFNACAWCMSAQTVLRQKDTLEGSDAVFQRRQLILSAVYVFGCGFRSLLPRADLQRIGLYDSWMSSVMVGRSVATVAELCFAIQWAILLHSLSREAGSRTGVTISRLLVPLIVVAELFSWYAVLTTSPLGNACEETLWAVSALLLVVGCLAVWSRCHPGHRPVLMGILLLGVGYLAFMSTVDIPMYLSRWKEAEANGQVYLTLDEGCRDVWCRRHVTFEWEAWRAEVPWMTLYFSFGVWSSIALAHIHWFKPRRVVVPQRWSL